jgi:branched-subunit amino acid ABC-type transport system permease component
LEFLANLLPHLLNGISLGLLFALIALGFMLIVGVMEVINLAHGSLFALGAYTAISLIGFKVNFYLAILLAPLLVALVGMVLEVCMRRTYGKDALYGLLLTFGAALVIEEIIRLVWGSGEKQLIPPPELSGAMLIGGLIYAKYRLYASLAAVLLIVGLYLFLERTPYGAMIKAGAHDSEMVRALGINLTRLRLFVFALGTALAAIWGVRPHMGVDAVIPAFVIIVLGGVGSFWGAVLAGILVGIVVGLTGAYASEWSLLSMYLLLIALVTFRARGLLGKKTALEN